MAFLFLFQEFATHFILTTAVDHDGRFDDVNVEQLKRLRGWAINSAVAHLYIERVVEEYSNTCGLLVPRDASSRQERLSSIPSAYNYQLEPPSKNLKSEADVMELFLEDYKTFLENYALLQNATGKFINQSWFTIHKFAPN